jgi:hypothetical protein
MTATATATRTPVIRSQRVRLHPDRICSSRNVAMRPPLSVSAVGSIFSGDRPPKRPSDRNTSAVEEARWWAVRRAQSQKPATYRCPFCDELLHAMSEHLIIAPEGNADRRRHAHTECVLAARKAGTFKTYDDQ